VLILYASIAAGSLYAFTDYTGVGPFDFVGVDNFVAIFGDATARGALLNTLLLAVGFVIFTNLFGMLFALALNRGLKSRHVLRVLIFAPVVLSPIAVSFVWQFMLTYTGPVNGLLEGLGLDALKRTWLGDPATAIWAVLLVMVWQNLGLVLVIYLAGLATVPPELEEAAAIDGAGIWARFVNITVPLIRPSIVVASTLMLIQGLRVFDQVMALTGGGPFGASETLATLVYKETFSFGNFGYGAALSLILTAVIIVFAGAQLLLTRGKREES
jgi:raffinose/stachyose/melibiose transport system permease protein